jgi:hypothetical protein
MGFWVVESKDVVRWPLNGKELVFLVEDGHINEQMLKQKVLVDASFSNDRNKSDTFLRLISMVQVLWFVLNRIARVAQKLPLTTLELTVFAYFMPNLFIFYLWRAKPTDVGTSLLINLEVTVSDIQTKGVVACRYPQAQDPWYRTPLDFVGRSEWHASILYAYCKHILVKLARREPNRHIERPIKARSDFQFPGVGLKVELVELSLRYCLPKLRLHGLELGLSDRCRELALEGRRCWCVKHFHGRVCF